jgi:hypothetical protein
MPKTQLISNIIKVENEHSRMVEQYENESVYYYSSYITSFNLALGIIATGYVIYRYRNK